MGDSPKFLLPKPDFSKKSGMAPKSAPHFLTPSGMTLLPREKQPPPMYGPKGSTIPPRFLNKPKSEEKPQERHFCEPCEMELQSMDDFRRHRAQHERCPVDGCKYKAHPSVMDKHVTELHASGIFEKIKKISTPEEIAAWREERRKKYPTLANTQMRQLAQEQRQRRGERLEENKSRFGRQEDRKRARNRERCTEQRQITPKNKQQERNQRGKDKRLPRFTKNNVEKKPALPVNCTEQTEGDVDDICCVLPMFKGTSTLKDYKHEKEKQPKTKHVLSSLLGMYGSDEEDGDDSDVEEEENSKTSKQEKQISEQKEELSNSNQQIEDYIVQEIRNESMLDNENIPLIEEQLKTAQNEHPVDKTCSISTIQSLIDSPVKINNSKGNDATTSGVSQEKAIEDVSTNNSSDEAPEEAPIERTTAISYDLSNSTSTANNLDSEASTSKRAKLENTTKSLPRKRKYGLDYRKVRLRKQNTMLEKLLEPDIRHERNVLLQCVRFVCQNNFFGVGSGTTSSESKTTPQ